MIVVQSFQMNPYGSDTLTQVVLVCAFAVWCLILLRNFVSETKEVVSVIRRYGFDGIYSQYLEFWNVVDWISVLGSIPVLTVWFTFDASVYDINNTIHRMIDQGLMYDEAALTDLYSMVDKTNFQAKLQRYLFCAYPLIVMLRLFKSFHAQPRLALVTRTLVECAVDIGHFGLIFCVIAITYTVGGICLFGQDLFYYANFPRALHSTFRMILGDSSWDDLSLVGEVPAGAYYWTFNILVVTVMLNMLLAIIMDAYSTVKESIGDNAETLVSQAQEIYRRFLAIRANTMVAMDDIQEAFLQASADEMLRERGDFYRKQDGADDLPLLREDARVAAMGATNLLSFDDLTLKLPSVPPSQIEELMNGAKAAYERAHPIPSPEDQALETVMNGVEGLRHVMQSIYLHCHIEGYAHKQHQSFIHSEHPERAEGEQQEEELPPPPQGDLAPSLPELAIMFRDGLLTRQEFDGCKQIVLSHLGIVTVNV